MVAKRKQNKKLQSIVHFTSFLARLLFVLVFRLKRGLFSGGPSPVDSLAMILEGLRSPHFASSSFFRGVAGEPRRFRDEEVSPALAFLVVVTRAGLSLAKYCPAALSVSSSMVGISSEVVTVTRGAGAGADTGTGIGVP